MNPSTEPPLPGVENDRPWTLECGHPVRRSSGFARLFIRQLYLPLAVAAGIPIGILLAGIPVP